MKIGKKMEIEKRIEIGMRRKLVIEIGMTM